jgi:hypothetical protein
MAPTCGSCRHANHDTDDVAEGLWACPWLGSTHPDAPCRIVYEDTGEPVFETYDGTNGTWGNTGSDLREAPAGYAVRAVRLAPGVEPEADLDLSLDPLPPDRRDR